ncbi:hypothetical protein, partial [Bacteroides sp.]|uniref:hypothetical protein n=1 Tax=Bacteroides sp. TaxID=29523 RepID=UPI00258CB62C
MLSQPLRIKIDKEITVFQQRAPIHPLLEYEALIDIILESNFAFRIDPKFLFGMACATTTVSCAISSWIPKPYLILA